MKKLIIIAVIFLTAIIEQSFAQDILKPQAIDSMSSSLIFRGNYGFLRGWNWGTEGSNLDNALYIPTKNFLYS